MPLDINIIREGISKNNNKYLVVVFKDTLNEKETGFIVFEKNLWHEMLTKYRDKQIMTGMDLDFLNQVKNGYITEYKYSANGEDGVLDIFVFSEMTEKDAFEMQKYKLKRKTEIHQRINEPSIREKPNDELMDLEGTELLESFGEEGLQNYNYSDNGYVEGVCEYCLQYPCRCDSGMEE